MLLPRPVRRTLLTAAAPALLAVTLSAHADGRQSGTLDSEFNLAAQWRDNILRKRVNEPSGIVYHPGRDSLFVVGDEGRISEIDRKGRRLQRKRLGGGDLEGVTVNPNTGLLYVAVEGRERVLELSPKKLKLLREFDIERRQSGFTAFPKGSNGIEAIAFVPNPQRRHGGTFWVANQGEGVSGDKEAARLVELELPLSTPGDGRGHILRVFDSRIGDLAGMHYLPKRRRLALISDRHNLYLELSLDGEVLLARSLPGRDQEGIAVDGDGAIYIAVDGGGGEGDAVMKLPPRR